jgi:hypothetical protein
MAAILMDQSERPYGYRIRLARRFSWLRWLLSDAEIVALTKEYNAAERARLAAERARAEPPSWGRS